MTARNRSRTALVGAALAALLAPLALVVAAAAPANAAGQFHEISMYKKEKHVDISGDYPDKNMHEHVYCEDGDYALDGMWRVDSVAQANPPETFGDERDVYFTASYNDPMDPAEWHFRAVNFADGKAQVKLFVTCIRYETENQHLHTHPIRVSNQYSYSTAGVPAGQWHPDHNFTCPSDSYAVAPGFQLTSHGPDYDAKIRLFRSWPTSPNFRSWHWAFVVEDPAVDVNLTLRCLRTTTGAAKGHAHQVPMSWRPHGYAGVLHNLIVNKTQEIRLNCDDHPNGSAFQLYKAMVGAFWINNPHYVWFLGMDPRPKQRSYKFWREPGGDNGVYLAALCIKNRTGKQIKPVP